MAALCFLRHQTLPDLPLGDELNETLELKLTSLLCFSRCSSTSFVLNVGSIGDVAR
jgi:hypothetical protein